MMRLQKVYKFVYGKTEFEFKPQHKFNFIIDDSGKGKTWLCKQIVKSTDVVDFNVLTYSGLSSTDLSKEYSCVFIIDETQFLPIAHALGWNKLQDSPNIFLIITRNIPPQLSVDYRAVFTFHSKDRKYWLERKYKDYTEFKESEYYVTEDSGSGYYYFKNKYKATTPVGSGKDNLLLRNLNNTTVIADGSAFARDIAMILHKYPDVKLFLPESFEGLVISGTCTNLSAKLFHVAYTDDILSFRSIEKYFEQAVKILYPIYNKSKRQEYLDVLDLEHTQHYGITATIAQRNNISVFDPIACKQVFS